MAIMHIDTGVLSPSPPATDKAHQDLKKATQQFKSFFVDTLFKEMRKTVAKSDLLKDDDHQQEIFQDMMDEKVADTVSQRGDFGLAKMMYDELSQTLPPSTTQDTKKDGKNTGKTGDTPNLSVDVRR